MSCQATIERRDEVHQLVPWHEIIVVIPQRRREWTVTGDAVHATVYATVRATVRATDRATGGAVRRNAVEFPHRSLGGRAVKVDHVSSEDDEIGVFDLDRRAQETRRVRVLASRAQRSGHVSAFCAEFGVSAMLLYIKNRFL